RFRPPEGEPIIAKVLNKSIETAQKRVEQRNYSIRKHTLEYDDVMNMQRKEVYAFRNEILRDKNPVEIACSILESVCQEISKQFFQSRASLWNPEGFRTWLMTHFPVNFDANAFDDEYLTIEEIEQIAAQKIINNFKYKLDHEANIIAHIQKASGKEVNPVSILSEILCNLLLQIIDRLWQGHLLDIDHLRTDVNLRVIGQKDPLMEFKHEAFALFDSLNQTIKLEIGHSLFRFEMVPSEASNQKKSSSALQLEELQSFFPPVDKQKAIADRKKS
ncbi:MAG: preprotein translocase subunit SecA, partial [Simkaniaceae bacterium]|nr:preprotein translocase subunit SecA [Simkaniaceae bacterium]